MKEIIEQLRDKVAERTDGFDVEIKEFRKNNGILKTGIAITPKDDLFGAVIYVDEILKNVTENNDLDSIADEIVSDFNNARNTVDASNFLIKDYVLNHVVCVLVNRNRNDGLDIPCDEYLDMLIEYRVLSVECDKKEVSFLVTNGLCKKLGIDKSELTAAAKRNMLKNGFKAVLLPQMIRELTGESEDEYPDYPDAGYVVQSKQPTYGASVMLFPENFAEIAEKTESDLYILPSSIHEVIAIPAKGDAAEIKRMVRDINAKEVLPEEVLGDTVYRYSRRNKEITISA